MVKSYKTQSGAKRVFEKSTAVLKERGSGPEGPVRGTLDSYDTDLTDAEWASVAQLRRAAAEKIVLAELAEAQRQLETKLASPGLPDPASAYVASAYQRLQRTAQQWTRRKAEQLEVTREMLAAASQRNLCRDEHPPAEQSQLLKCLNFHEHASNQRLMERVEG